MEKLITENRKCIYRKSVCTFHGFFQRSMVIKPSIMVGGDSGGVIAYPVAGKLMEVTATSIRFVEE